jgi:hypothetical protein
MADRSEEARLRAEANFKKKQQRTEEGEKVWGEHLAAGKAADANRAKLKAQRLARDAAEKPSTPKGARKKSRPPAPKAKRSARRAKWTRDRDVGRAHRAVRNRNFLMISRAQCRPARAGLASSLLHAMCPLRGVSSLDLAAPCARPFFA